MKNLGGQAVIEGVLIMAPDKYAIACRTPEKKIVTKVEKHNLRKKWYRKLPFIRGIFSLVDMLVVSTKALTWSANQQGEEEELGGWELFITFGIAILLTIGIFILLPYYLAKFIAPPPSFAFNILDGVFRLVAFFVYLFVMSFFKDIKRMFEYHGAEHMSVHCYEAKKELTVANVKKFPKEHARCGTSLLVFVVIVSILMFSFIKTGIWWINIPVRILLIPVVAGVSYELLKASAKFKWLSWLSLPGIWTQKLTTRKPSGDQIEVAIMAVNKAK